MEFDYFLEILIKGLSLGAIYGLIAIGYTMVYGVLGMINFSHGEVFIVGAFISLISFMLLMQGQGFMPSPIMLSFSLILVMLVSMALTSAWSWMIERIAYRPLRGSFRLAPLITAIGMSIIIQNFIQIQQGERSKALPDFVTGGFIIPGTTVQILNKQLVVFIITALLLAIFSYIVTKTSLGRAQRACAQDSKMAALCIAT